MVLELGCLGFMPAVREEWGVEGERRWVRLGARMPGSVPAVGGKWGGGEPGVLSAQMLGFSASVGRGWQPYKELCR